MNLRFEFINSSKFVKTIQFMKSTFKYFLVLILILDISCNKGIKLPPSSFSRYISGFTYGVISTRSHFEIELQDPYKGGEKIGDEIKTELFYFSPSIEGRTILKSPNKVEFIPTKPLDKDKTYDVKFKLKDAIKEVDGEHENFEYSVKTIKESCSFVNEGIVVVKDAAKEKVFDYKGLITTADFTESKDVESNVSIDTKHSIVWSHAANGTDHSFTIKNIVATDKTQTIKLDVDLNNLTNDKADLAIEIPTKFDFTMTSMTVDQNDNNKVTIVFSENLSSTGNEGLASIEGKFDYGMNIDANKLILTPNDKNLFGDVKIKVLAGVQSQHGKKLVKDYEKIVSFGSLRPSAEIIGTGNILVNNDGASLPIKTVGLNQIRVDVYKIFQSNVLYFLQNNSLQDAYNIKRFGKKCYSEVIKLNGKSGFKNNRAYNYSLDLSDLVKLEKGAIYQVKLSFDKSMTALYGGDAAKGNSKLFDFSMIQNRFDEDEIANDEEGEGDYEYYYPDGYEYEKREDPSDDSYYNYERFSKKNVLVSNIGLIAKKGTNNKIYATCVDLLTAQPMSGATIELFSYQFQPVGKNSTNGDGFAELESSEKPYFVVATKDGQKNYIKLDKYNSQAIDVFDVEGNQAQNGMKCYVYGERGVWRPGDKIYMTMILSNGYNDLPKDLPCQMELVNPTGQVFDRQVNDKPLNGFYSFVSRTAPDAVTGNWTARFKVGGLKYDKTVKIETVKPNRLRIVTENNTEFITQGQPIKYQTSWLNGASSAGLKATVDMNFYATSTEFKGFNAYTFNDKTKQFATFEQSVYSGTTAADGSFQYNFNLETDASTIPGMLNAVSTTKVFENGGDFSIQYDTKKFSFYNSYIGHKVNNDASQYYLSCDKNYMIDVVNLNPQGQFLAKNKVKVAFYKVEYNWWYNSYNSNRYLDQEKIKQTIFEKEVDIVNGKIKVPLLVKRGGWGNYMIKVTDLTSNHSSSSFVYFESPYYQNDNSGEESKVIQMSKDKDKYKVGESVKLNMVSYFEGRALLSIENGAEVLETKWFDLKQGKNTLEFKVKENMSPNVYAYVSAIQAQPKTKNNLPIRMYGITPIMVDNSNSVLQPVIKAPAKIEPEQKMSFTVSETNGKNMTYTVAIVDEGLLGISGYKTPDPWKFFYGKEALGVLTWDVFDDVMGAFAGVFQDIFSIGGDTEALDQMNKAKSNRYESVVKYLGPFELKGGSNTHTIDVPNYVGNLKLMVISGGKNYSFGSATADVQVSKPLMVLGTLPRVLSLDEEIELPVNVFVTEKSIRNVNIEVITDNKVTLISPKTQALAFNNVEDQIINFKLKTGSVQGVTKVTVIARSGKYTSTYEMEVPIRIANPPTIDVQQIALNPHETKTIPVQVIGVNGTNKLIVESSSIPELNIKSRVDELIAYPHGCLEQTTSALFPQLYLNELTSLNTSDKEFIQSNVKAGFEKYKSFQSNGGGLSYWPNSGYIDDYATTYATHFMVEAKAKGYSYNDDMMNKAIDIINSNANGFNPASGEIYQRSYQAYKLYVLALAGKPNLGAMNRLKETTLETHSRIKLALAYSITGKNNIAQQLMANVPVDITPYIDDRYTYGSDNLDNAFLLELFIRLNDKVNAYKFFRKNIVALNSRTYLGTQSTAMLLKSINTYLAKYKVTPTDILFSHNGKAYTMKGDKPAYSQEIQPVNGTITVTNNTNAVTVVNVVRKGVELSVKSVVSPYISMNVEYIDKAGKSISSDKIARQTDFKQVIKITNKSSQTLSNMALTNYVPAGWEIINKRIADAVSNTGMDYQDIRDDMVLSYFSIAAGETKIIIQDFNASYEGSYNVPAIIVESMYNPQYKSVLGSYKTSVYR
jgi:alpha-2-macroglobulin